MYTGERHLMLFDSQLTGKKNWSGQRSISLCAGWSTQQASSRQGGGMGAVGILLRSGSGIISK